MYRRTIFRAELEAFKATWPCHGISDKVSRISFEWDSKGDLVDVQAFYRNGKPVVDVSLYDGPAIVALCHDAQRSMHPEHAAMRGNA